MLVCCFLWTGAGAEASEYRDVGSARQGSLAGFFRSPLQMLCQSRAFCREGLEQHSGSSVTSSETLQECTRVTSPQTHLLTVAERICTARPHLGRAAHRPRIDLPLRLHQAHIPSSSGIHFLAAGSSVATCFLPGVTKGQARLCAACTQVESVGPQHSATDQHPAVKSYGPGGSRQVQTHRQFKPGAMLSVNLGILMDMKYKLTQML